MILGQVSTLDCIAFVLFLIPNLLLNVNILSLLLCGLKILPFLLLRLPFEFFVERFLLRTDLRPLFYRQATAFQDIVIRCVTWAFAYLPYPIGRIFFSKHVALPFARFRMLRHFQKHTGVHWEEIKTRNLSGLWLISNPTKQPDIVVYYCHGGGFVMGSSYFYFEALVALVSLLRDAGYSNPGLFALEYSLAPEAAYPTQVEEALSGYRLVLSYVQDPCQIIVSGDSAGALIVITMLQRLAGLDMDRPGLAVLISPWISLVSENNRNTSSDYLNAESLHKYAQMYAGKMSAEDPAVSPGMVADESVWKQATPNHGWYFIFGSEEVFAPEVHRLMGILKPIAKVQFNEERGLIHAWPIANLFLGRDRQERLKGIRSIVRVICEASKLHN